MPIYTSNYLKNLSKKKTGLYGAKILNESKKIHTSFDIFLSHSFLDKDEVEGLYIELTNQGYSVYVDWIIDPKLDRANVTKESAKLIKSRLKMSKSLLLAISINASVSKWMPWELGFVDGNTDNCAIIPISSDIYNVPNSYVGFEYLLLYPFIKKTPTRGLGEKLFVIEGAKKYVIFDDWLKLNKRPEFKNISIY